ncbi:MAG: T9SS type A sorting domain-containing protein [Saprospiraceae bacterium]
MKYTILIFTILLAESIFGQTVLNIAGGQLKVSGSEAIVLQNTKWHNDGTFTPGTGTVEFTGTASTDDSAITGSSNTSFYNLTVNKTTNNVGLESNTGIQNSLHLQSGCIQLGDADLVIDPAASVSGTTTAFVKTDGMGSLVRTVSGGAVAFPIGTDACTPLVLENAGTSDIFYVRAEEGVLQNGTSGNPQTSGVVDITWHVEEAIAGGSDVTLTASWYAADELSGFNRNNCSLAHYTGGAWDEGTPGSAAGSDPYSISRSGITSFSPFAVSGAEVLPIELLYFYGEKAERGVQLYWETATEINNSHFEVEWSTDGRAFQKIGRVAGAGTTTQAQQYGLLHETPSIGNNYYRLKQVDFDGKYEHSRIVNIRYQPTDIGYSIYPNPSADFVVIENAGEEGLVEIFDVHGRFIESFQLQSNSSKHSLAGLPKGTYFLKIKDSLKRVIVQ